VSTKGRSHGVAKGYAGGQSKVPCTEKKAEPDDEAPLWALVRWHRTARL